MELPPLVDPEVFAGLLADHGRAEQSLRAATAAVRDHCRWHIAPVVAQTENVACDGGRVLALPTLRLVSVQSVTVDGEQITGYRADPAGLLVRESGWPEGTVTVEFTHGYDDAPAVAALICEQAARAVTSPLGGVHEKMGPYEYFPAPGASSLGPEQHEVLNRYYLPSAA
ncbi:conserved hypothetical protein [Segniliparus rotundus DSM 44985]|uniref:Head-to-tail adaptor n=1 Tax=Segniliparus rotundus (strain ATCC BAA-972 / CDC 1076 / CIP 108378 / DSM 44985 / JCM 13578) TaxID=640132 RepID=D6ZFB0_SEGRD|nr:conserved hypothetical protein [Segniliparus rotundus DSM 44985]